jgi:hypothetical protein
MITWQEDHRIVGKPVFFEKWSHHAKTWGVLSGGVFLKRSPLKACMYQYANILDKM